MKDADALQGVPPMPPAFEAAFLRLMPRRVGNGLPPPRKVKDAQPVYPPIAQSARVQGTIVMEAIVDDAGRVAAARVLRSIPLLDAAALAAVRQWEFQPARIDAQPTAIVMRMTIGFFLQ
jgi:protein TonB